MRPKFVRIIFAIVLFLIAISISINFFGPARGVLFIGLIFVTHLLIRPQKAPLNPMKLWRGS